MGFISDRLNRLAPSPTVAITDLALNMKAAGRTVIGLAAGEPDFDTPQHIKDAAIAAMAGFVLDGVLLLSFGPQAAFAAAQERDALLLQIGWLRNVGTSMLPARPLCIVLVCQVLAGISSQVIC